HRDVKEDERKLIFLSHANTVKKMGSITVLHPQTKNTQHRDVKEEERKSVYLSHADTETKTSPITVIQPQTKNTQLTTWGQIQIQHCLQVMASPFKQRDIQEEERKSPHLCHANTVNKMSSISVIQPHTKWLKSQSMQEINTSITPGDNKKEAAADLARSYGLDTSLYASECAPMSRSTEALNAWRSPANSETLDLYEECSHGLIHFSASYYQKSKKLYVHINKLESLPPKGNHYTYSIFVKLVVLPMEKPVRVSKLIKDDLNPTIEEDFEFYVKEPLGKVLRLSVYDADHLSKYDAVGHALFYLEDVIAGRPRRYAMKLYKQSQPDVSPGIIHLTLRYKKDTMIATVLIKEAHNLLLTTGASKSTRTSDKYNTYVKVVYYFAGQKSKSKRTIVVANSRNPTYNQTFSFKLSSNFLHDSMIVISVMMKGMLRKDVAIGRLILGPFHYAETHVKTPWGRALLDQQEVSHWFRLYL
ncbi:hypothetical protein L9F63_015428, partial [Diploptera punctata]